MYKLIVMDFEIGEVFIYNFDPNAIEPEELTDENGDYVINDSCEWMVVNDELKINFK
jgi:hypothetical protein